MRNTSALLRAVIAAALAASLALSLLASLPEPGAWATMVAGFGVLCALQRRRP